MKMNKQTYEMQQQLIQEMLDGQKHGMKKWRNLLELSILSMQQKL